MKLERDGHTDLIPAPPTKYCPRIKADGEQCGNLMGYGTDHPGVGMCKFHGGSSPNHVKKAELERVRREMTVMGQPIDVDPFEALLNVIRVTEGEIRFASLMIAELEHDAAVVTSRSVKTRPLNLGGMDGEDRDRTVEEITETNDAKLTLWLRVRQEAMDRQAKYAKMALDAGIDERLVRVEEQQGQIINVMLQGIFADLGLTGDPRLPMVVRKHLESVVGSCEEV